MNSSNVDLFKRPFADPSMTDTGSYNLEKFTKVSTSQSRSSDITIMTAEGDKVTLSSSMSTSATYMTYNQIGKMNTDNGTQVTKTDGKYLSFESNQAMSIQVEGDLNEDEMRQIHKALKIINHAMQAALSGDMNHAMNHALKIGKLDTISSVDAVLDIQKQVSIEKQVTATATATGPADLSGNLDNAIPNLNNANPSNADPQPMTALAGAASDDTTQQEMPKLSDLVDNMIQAVKDADVSPKKMKQPIHALFQKLRKEIPKQAPQADFKHKMIKDMFAQLMDKLGHLPDLKPGDQIPQTSDENAQADTQNTDANQEAV